jgi:hypothetical protein
MNYRETACLLTMLLGNTAMAADTAPGKIVGTQGHINPACRVVTHRENATGTVRYFRIAPVTGPANDISAIALAALVSNSDVVINYDPSITTGCGPEPRVQYIAILAP